MCFFPDNFCPQSGQNFENWKSRGMGVGAHKSVSVGTNVWTLEKSGQTFEIWKIQDMSVGANFFRVGAPKLFVGKKKNTLIPTLLRRHEKSTNKIDTKMSNMVANSEAWDKFPCPDIAEQIVLLKS